MKPMLACEYSDLHSKKRMLATPKIDGIRFLIVKGRAVTRSMKALPNAYVREMLEKHLPEGVDGEITVGSTFQETTSAVMSHKGKPGFKVWLFDLVVDPLTPYIVRCKNLSEAAAAVVVPDTELPFELEVLTPKTVYNYEELLEFESLCLEQGYEGVMLRDPLSPYKFGRSTAREGYLVKKKLFSDSEAMVTGFVEEMKNNNDSFTNEVGNNTRTSHQQGLVGKESLGSLEVKDLKTNITFNVGSGFTASDRKELWASREKLIGRVIKYKYFSVGVKVAPRHPVFLGFRESWDM